MPSVRCPSCKRLLNVRDDMIGLEARCPLCAATFPAEPEGGRAVPYQRLPDAPDPARPWRPAGHRDDDRVPTFPGPRRDQDLPLDPLRRAGNWLFGLSIVSLVWNMTCGCGGVITMLDRSGAPAEVGFIVISAFLLQLFFAVLILIGGQGIRTGARNRGLCWTGVVLALCECVFVAARGGMLLMALDSGRAEDFTMGFNCLSLLISGGLFIAGLYAMQALRAKPPEKNDPFED